MRTLSIVVAAALLSAGCGAAGSGAAASSTSPSGQFVAGEIDVPGTSPSKSKDDCLVSEGYSDVAASQVVLSDDTGKTLGLGNLGVATATFPLGQDAADLVATCVYPFKLGPANLDPNAYYSIEVGRRGKVRFTGQQLLAPPTVLTLGS